MTRLKRLGGVGGALAALASGSIQVSSRGVQVLNVDADTRLVTLELGGFFETFVDKEIRRTSLGGVVATFRLAESISKRGWGVRINRNGKLLLSVAPGKTWLRAIRPGNPVEISKFLLSTLTKE